ncbi:hypothetical protein E4U53_006055 [Claviceps sorghi]|nr:hypothetical protein E4U53_006055 [Claviceps sorghi]
MALKSNQHSEQLLATMESEEKLVIALDFGTTYSGVAFCFANQTDAKPVAIMNWPGNRGLFVPKIPTIIEYSKEETKSFKWGASADKLNDAVIAIKLLLDPDQERPVYLPSKNIKNELSCLPKKPFQIAADFIGAIYEHALKEISKTVPKAYMDICEKEFVLSVPAVWSDAAKNATLKAAELAGISPVTIVKEPEAAALYSIKSLDFSIKKKDAFVVCDAGGGTVDLISYEVMSTVPQLQVKELVPGSGGMAGSLGLNQRFAAAVEELVGSLQWSDLKTSKAWPFAERQFDQEIKTAFHGDPDEEYFVNFPMADLWDHPDGVLEKNTWRLTGRELSRIFEPLVADILRMIEHQVQKVQLKKKKISGIFLVGGFGSSHYLMQRVKEHFPTIQVLQPSDAWAAIVKGSVLSRLPGQAAVTSTCATRHYGTRCRSVYKELRDEGEETWLDRQGITRVSTMAWYIFKGNDILRDQRIKIRMCHEVDDIHEARKHTIKLWECEDETAPTHPSKAKTLRSNCNVTADLRNVPKDKFQPIIACSLKQSYIIFLDFIVTLKSAVMTFSVEVDGEEVGSAEVDYA